MNRIIEDYLNKIKHLRIAKDYLQDLLIIEDTINDFDYDYATQVISYLSIKYRKDLNTIGRMLTGIMVLNQSELGPKTGDDLVDDLLYLYDCIIILGAVHCGLEDTVKSATLKIKRAKEYSA